MMRWVAGWHPTVVGAPVRTRPRGGRRVIGEHELIWTVGYESRHIRTVGSGDATLSVIGSCQATDAELRRALARFAEGDALDLAPWSGSYITSASRRGETVVVGDLAGAARVYFTPVHGGYLWTSAATPLADHVGGGLRLEALALELAVSGLELYGGKSPYERVCAVAPGDMLRMRGDGHVIEPRSREAAAASPEEVAERFAVLLPDAVIRRVRNARAASVDLGGVDSGSLAVLAAGAGNITAITYADHPGSEDVRYARQVVADTPGLRHVVVPRSPSSLHCSGLHDLGATPVVDLPSADLAYLGQTRAILRAAAQAGSSDHIIGLGGDEVLSAWPTSLVTMLELGGWSALRAAALWARWQRTSRVQMWLALARLASKSYPEALRELARSIGPDEIDADAPDDWRPHLAWCSPMRATRLLTPNAAARVSEGIVEYAACAPKNPDPDSLHSWQDIRRGAANTAGARAVAESLGLTLHTPFFDHEVLRLLLGVPAFLREPPGKWKPLLRENMADGLPDAITQRTTKGAINNTAYLGPARNADALRELVRSSILVELGVLDPVALEDETERVIAGIGGAGASLHRIVATERWLRRTASATWWEPVTDRDASGDAGSAAPGRRDLVRIVPLPGAGAVTRLRKGPTTAEPSVRSAGLPRGVSASSRAAPWVTAVFDPEGGGVLFNSRSGRFTQLLPIEVELWHSLERGLTVEAAVAVIASEHELARAPMHPKIWNALTTLAEENALTEPGARTMRRVPVAPMQRGTGNRITAREAEASARHLITPRIALGAADVLLRLPYPALVSVLRALHRIPGRGRTRTETELLVAEVRARAPRSRPIGDCLRTSLAACVAGALRGQTPYWCHAVRFRPFEVHAWVEAEDGIAVDAEAQAPDRPFWQVTRI